MEKKDEMPTPMDTESAESESSMETVEDESKDAGDSKQGPLEGPKGTVETTDPAGQAKQALEAHPPKRPTGGKKVTTKPSKKDESQAPMDKVVDKENVSDDVKPAPETMPPPQVRGKKSILSPRNKQSPRTSTEPSAACDEPIDITSCSSETQQAAEVWPPKVRVGGKKTSETMPSPSKGKKDEPHDASSTTFMEISRTDPIVATVKVQPGVNVPASSSSRSPGGEQNPEVSVEPDTPDSSEPSKNAPPMDAASKHGSGPAPDPEDDDDDDDEEVVEDRDKSTYL